MNPKNTYSCRFLYFISIFFLICSAAGADTQISEGKLLIMVYASGGSLETEYGLITDDIRQIVVGGGNITPDILEIVVAYGGSKKPGWQGMTIANLSTLSTDLKDGNLNGSPNLANFTDANMGSYETLATFLTWTHEQYRYDRVILFLIGHGEAYTGMLFDENHKSDPLTLPELKKALNHGGYNVDLIGLDTCLMGSLEVASTIAGYAPFMIASQEVEPAQGWEYNAGISFLASHPQASIEDIGRIIISSYLENPSPGKTLSLLDLRETGAVLENLEKLSRNLLPLIDTVEGFTTVSQAFSESQQFGRTERYALDPATMDLIDVTKNLKQKEPILTDYTDMLLESIEKMVILTGHDDTIDTAGGVAILSPVQINSEFYQYYRDETAITPAWDRFMTRYLEIADRVNTNI
jgi:hypothetical protein